MAQIPKITAITDEFSANIEKTLKYLHKRNLEYCELRNVSLRSKGVEFKRIGKHTDASLAKIESTIKEYSFKVSALGSPLFNHLVPKTAEDKNAVFGELKRYFEIANRWDVKFIRIFSFAPNSNEFPRNYNDPSCEYMKQFQGAVDVLGEAALIAHDHHVKLALENEPALFGGSVDDNIQLIAALDKKLGTQVRKDSIGILFDPGNMWRHFDDQPPERMKLLYPNTIYTHVKDVAESKSGKRRHTVNGAKNGIMPYVDFFKDMRETGYDSYFSVETHFGGLFRWNNSVKCLEGLISLLGKAGWDVSRWSV